MPGGDGIGSLRIGSVIGRSSGHHARNSIPGTMGEIPQRGCGLAYDRGWRDEYYANDVPCGPEVTKEQQVEWLKGEAERLLAQLDAITRYAPELANEHEKQQVTDDREWLQGQLDAVVQRIKDLEAGDT